MKKSMFCKLQIKRAFKVYPAILLITVITFAVVAFAGYNVIREFSGGEDKKRIVLGLVGDTENTILDVGIYALQKMDSSRFIIEIVNMDEESAAKALKQRRISGFVHIPENYISGMMVGDNIPATFVTLGSVQNIGTILTGEVADVISHLLKETQAGIGSMQTTLYQAGMASEVEAATYDINLKYINFVLKRDSSYELEFTGLKGVSTGGYYISSFILFFLLLLGISFGKLLSAKNISLSRMMKLSGISASRQVLCEHFAFLTVVTVTMLFFAIIAGIITGSFNPGIPETEGVGVIGCVGFVIAIFPVIVMITMMHSLFYEISHNTVSSVLLQFLVSVGLGYISGCFYPNSFFPDVIRNVADLLPAGVGFSYIRNIMAGTLQLKDLVAVVAYFALFALAAIGVRRCRMEGDGV